MIANAIIPSDRRMCRSPVHRFVWRMLATRRQETSRQRINGVAQADVARTYNAKLKTKIAELRATTLTGSAAEFGKSIADET
jgi:hypothetical protein